MMQLKADLHTHTIISDGTYTPQEIVFKADLSGLTCVAITDHDAVDGISTAKEEIKKRGLSLELLTGTELTAYLDKSEIHILAYGFDETDPDVKNYLEAFKKCRYNRIEKMIELLKSENINVSMRDVLTVSDGGVMGRLHLAKTLIRHGYIDNIAQAFQQYIGAGCSAYVPKLIVSPQDLIKRIHSWNAVAVLAHPKQCRDLEEIERFVGFGIDGFEAYHPNVDKPLRKQLKKLARQRGLLITGGSDTHGAGLVRPDVGGVTVPYHFVEALYEKLGQMGRTM
ncbi:MAG: PHP domain-containing protein [Spirochaetes bacterium]|nr:PHP domain-containing protein [Spirochaetota bacterium]MCK5266890.1 PHP domain-containing protein [Spirochaetota bacterium]